MLVVGDINGFGKYPGSENSFLIIAQHILQNIKILIYAQWKDCESSNVKIN